MTKKESRCGADTQLYEVCPGKDSKPCVLIECDFHSDQLGACRDFLLRKYLMWKKETWNISHDVYGTELDKLIFSAIAKVFITELDEDGFVSVLDWEWDDTPWCHTSPDDNDHEIDKTMVDFSRIHPREDEDADKVLSFYIEANLTKWEAKATPQKWISEHELDIATSIRESIESLKILKGTVV